MPSRKSAIGNVSSTSMITDGVVTNAKLATPATGVPVGTIVAWAKSIAGTPALDTDWEECDGSAIANVSSPMAGQNKPNLNGNSDATSKFLRGAATSGGTGGTATHNHINGPTNAISTAGGSQGKTDLDVATIPPYYQVVFVIRVH